MKFKTGVKFFTGMICATMLNCSQVLAATKIDIGVSPSRFVDEVVEKGDSKTYKINVANRVMDVGDDFKVTFNVKGYLEDEFGDVVETDIITIEDNNFTLDSNSLKVVDIEFDVPEDFESGNYVARIDFEQEDKDGFFGNQINVLSVPIHMFIGDMDEYNSRVRDFELLSNWLDIGVESTTVSDEVFSNIFKVLNPFKTKSVIRGILDRPVYNFNVNDSVVLDYNEKLFVPMIERATTGVVSDNKYIEYKEEDKDVKLKTIRGESDSILIVLENDNEVVVPLNNSVISDIMEQVKNISNVNKDITLGELMETLIVPSEKGMAKPVLYLGTEVKNLGNTTTAFNGEFKLVKDNKTEIKAGVISSPTVKSNSEETFRSLVSNDKLDDGSYVISGTLTNKIKTEDIAVKFKVGDMRKNIVTSLIIFLVVFYVVLVAVVVLIVKLLKKSDNEEKEGRDKKDNDEKGKTEETE